MQSVADTERGMTGCQISHPTYVILVTYVGCGVRLMRLDDGWEGSGGMGWSIHPHQQILDPPLYAIYVLYISRLISSQEPTAEDMH